MVMISTPSHDPHSFPPPVLDQRDEVSKTRQMKEAIFEQKVRQDILEESNNHLKW